MRWQRETHCLLSCSLILLHYFSVLCLRTNTYSQPELRAQMPMLKREDEAAAWMVLCVSVSVCSWKKWRGIWNVIIGLYYSISSKIQACSKQPLTCQTPNELRCQAVLRNTVIAVCVYCKAITHQLANLWSLNWTLTGQTELGGESVKNRWAELLKIKYEKPKL